MFKLRAWQKKQERMLKVAAITFNENGNIVSVQVDYGENTAPRYIVYSKHDSEWSLDYLEMMRYTDRVDVNDNQICEGDILEDFINEKRYEVIWDEYGMFLFNPVGTKGQAIDYYELEDEASLAATIIIGNKYENREFLC